MTSVNDSISNCVKCKARDRNHGAPIYSHPVGVLEEFYVLVSHMLISRLEDAVPPSFHSNIR